jgi:SagB-type dehydrogenase family enzyme
MTGILRLPPPQHTAVDSFESVLIARRSIRAFTTMPVSLTQLAHLLWAGNGISSVDGRRTAPSAGGLYPLTLHVAAGNVRNAPAAVYCYQPNGHRLVTTAPGDVRTALADAAFDQSWIATAPAVIVIAGSVERTAEKYGERAAQYVSFEAGAAAQNIALQAVALGLGSAVIGAFYDAELGHALALPTDQCPFAIIAVGHPA